MPTWEYTVVQFTPAGAHPGDFEKKLNELASSGKELVSILEPRVGVLWIVMRQQRQAEPMDRPITHNT